MKEKKNLTFNDILTATSLTAKLKETQILKDLKNCERNFLKFSGGFKESNLKEEQEKRNERKSTKS